MRHLRIMAVDYGDARTGIAISDALNMMAGEAFVIKERHAEALADAICREAEKRGVGTLVVGHPKNMDGSAGPRAEKSSGLAELLREKSGLTVVLWDERRTTVDAHRILSDNNRHGRRRKETVDAVAASLILEGYLNSLRISGEERDWPPVEI